uniref:CUE domain-containing protein n=1 Tax=Rhabditophanes sp. KR3021 TaxID=114890 RepID=A0AC35TLL7_9BILA
MQTILDIVDNQLDDLQDLVDEACNSDTYESNTDKMSIQSYAKFNLPSASPGHPQSSEVDETEDVNLPEIVSSALELSELNMQTILDIVDNQLDDLQDLIDEACNSDTYESDTDKMSIQSYAKFNFSSASPGHPQSSEVGVESTPSSFAALIHEEYISKYPGYFLQKARRQMPLVPTNPKKPPRNIKKKVGSKKNP